MDQRFIVFGWSKDMSPSRWFKHTPGRLQEIIPFQNIIIVFSLHVILELKVTCYARCIHRGLFSYDTIGEAIVFTPCSRQFCRLPISFTFSFLKNRCSIRPHLLYNRCLLYTKCSCPAFEDGYPMPLKWLIGTRTPVLFEAPICKFSLANQF
jgi:hypothetical protein